MELTDEIVTPFIELPIQDFQSYIVNKELSILADIIPDESGKRRYKPELMHAYLAGKGYAVSNCTDCFDATVGSMRLHFNSNEMWIENYLQYGAWAYSVSLICRHLPFVTEFVERLPEADLLIKEDLRKAEVRLEEVRIKTAKAKKLSELDKKLTLCYLQMTYAENKKYEATIVEGREQADLIISVSDGKVATFKIRYNQFMKKKDEFTSIINTYLETAKTLQKLSKTALKPRLKNRK